MPTQILTFLKYVFLVVLYLFFLRVVRAVWTELREPAPGTAAPGEVPVSRRQARQERKSREEAARQAPPTRLAIVDPPNAQGTTFNLGDELTVGRAPGCGVSLPADTFISQVHARVFRRDDGMWVEDLGSTNGTFVNDRKVTSPVALGPGDRLKVGRTTLELAP